MTAKIRTGVIGASGYTGSDLVRLAARHPNVEIVALTANTHAGKPMAEVFPHLGQLALPKLIKTEDANWNGVDAVFCGLPHATSQEVIAGLPPHLKVIDMSADFRFRDPATYERWYGGAHKAPELQKEAVYGLTEHYREEIAKARLVACPGCYPTAALTVILPLVRAGLIDAGDLIIDAKSGVSGAGRSLKQNILFCLRGRGGDVALRNRQPPSCAGDRAGGVARRRPGGDRQLHAASRADEPGRTRHRLCAVEARLDGR